MIASLYIHVPFCTRKCDYCDFYSVPIGILGNQDRERDALLDSYVERILADARALASRFNVEAIPSIYIGGGTPSLLGAERIYRLLAGLRELFPPQPQPICGRTAHAPREITVEANPESVDEKFLSACNGGGVSRVSVGIQSFYEPSRTAVRRCGALSGADLEQRLAIVSSHCALFSIDLISGLPLQTEAVLRSDIERALAFAPEHVSLYALTVEKGTALERNLRRNSCPALPDADEADALWLAGRSRLSNAGYEHYEVSNFSRNGKRCLHNTRYWRMENWLALGPGASGTVIDDKTGTARRYAVAADLENWLTAPRVQEECLDQRVLMKETLLMGFRYIEGPDPVLFRSRFGMGITDAIPKTLTRWGERGCLAETCIALNGEGLLLLNRFLSDAFTEIDSQ